MIEYDLKKEQQQEEREGLRQYYAKPHISETVDLDELADHMHRSQLSILSRDHQGHPHRCRDPHQGAPAHGQE